MRALLAAAALLIAISLGGSAHAEATAQSLGINPRATFPFAQVPATHAPGSCHFRQAANGMKLPDPACTPGAKNPTLTAAVLLNPAFRTGMVRDKLTSEKAKEVVYGWYGVAKPKGNVGPNQVCELDHLVDIASGGADSLDNVWPQCGDPAVAVGDREFKTKDRFAEHDVMRRVKAGEDLTSLQWQIATDWTQFIVAPSAH